MPKSSSDPAVHAPSTPGTPGNSVTPSANSSLSSSGELGQPSGEQASQARTRGSPGTQAAKPCSGATPTPFLLAGDRSPAPSVGSSSPQLQIKVSAPGGPKPAFLLASGCVSHLGARVLEIEWTCRYLCEPQFCVSLHPSLCLLTSVFADTVGSIQLLPFPHTSSTLPLTAFTDARPWPCCFTTPVLAF